MAEAVVAAVVTKMIENLFSERWSSVARSAGTYSQLKELSISLVQIQGVLADASQKQVTTRAVYLWLVDLRDLAYDIDDLLDDMATEAMSRDLNEESYGGSCTNKVWMIIPTCCTNFTPRNIKYGRKMSYKLELIMQQLGKLVKYGETLGLNVNVERSRNTYRRIEETSPVNESMVIGREVDKEALLRKLLGNEAYNENVSVVSIVGLGGIGKTTLARLVYNDKHISDHFELKSWVCVSDEFDVFSISKAIYADISGEYKGFADLDLLHDALARTLTNKRFLVVLDDVWNEDYTKWELLRRLFAVGAPGSKILVTTRKHVVASVMGATRSYQLRVLSHDKALSLLATHAINEYSFYKHPTLELHAEGIVKKCGGLPLALIIIGNVLRLRGEDEYEWTAILNSDIWNMHEESSILPALKLSYYELPSHLKKLFAYCALFPREYTFDKKELVLLWMAQGFLSQLRSKSMERLGEECFDDLVSRSFFQLQNHESRYTMHDLMSDLAVSVAREFFFLLDNETDISNRNVAFENIRHFSFTGQRHEVSTMSEALRRAIRLRTFISVSVSDGGERLPLPDNVLVELIPQLQFLRVLSLADHSITEVPNSIGGLRHIRYLNFSRTNIRELPEQISDLYNLQSLLVRGCYELSTLPKSFVKLVNLRHLDIYETPKLNKLPLGIGGLTSLQTLSKVIIERHYGFKISELKCLMDLQGQLSINMLENVTNELQAREADLQQKEGLDKLEMEWSDVFDDSRNQISEYEILTELRPHSKLRKLTILFYGGMKFPSWVGHRSFDQLRELTLRGCRRCTHLPSLGHLPSLHKLFVGSMNEVKMIGSKLLDPTSLSHKGPAFPSLEVLEFEDMQGWEEWSTADDSYNGSGGSFPFLRELSIVDCPKLSDLPETVLHSLSRLRVYHCQELENMCLGTDGKYWHIISEIPNLDVYKVVKSAERGVLGRDLLGSTRPKRGVLGESSGSPRKLTFADF